MKTKLFFFFLMISYALSSQEIYVDQNATGSNNGTDWTNAYTDLQTAITNIGTNTTINVAQGTYYPTATSDRTIYFNIPRDKKLLGGFPTGGGTRNPELYSTILSGDIGTIDDNTDNSYHVVYCNNTSPTTEFDGFIVEKGRADGTGTNESSGGGILISTTDTGSYGIKLNNCTVRNNYATYGGGISAGKQFYISNCKIYSNHATYNGGGLIISTSGNIYNSLIANNLSDDFAGGIYLGGSIGAPKAVNCVISNNQSLHGSGAYVYKGRLVNCVVTQNIGDYGAYLAGGGVWNSVVWGNEITSDQINIPGSSPEYYIQNNAVQDLTPFGTSIGLSIANNGSTFGENYPRFTSPTSFTGNATTPAQLDEILNANWYINPQSAAINFGDNSLYPATAGTPIVDFIGNNRTINTIIDAGAYEALSNITTNVATNQQPTSADLNGEILFAETINTISRGFVYATTSNFDVTTATSLTNSGTGLGNYSDTITGLAEDQLYYYRTWVEFDGIKYYGNEVQFKASNLIAYYPFNGNANDESGNGNNGIIENEATLTIDRFGNPDTAYSFDGVDDYISVPHSSSLDITGNEITISMWLYNDNPDTGNTWKGISKGGYDVGNGYELLFTNYTTSNGKTSLNIGGGGYFTSSFNSYSDQWIMLTGTFNSGVGKVYINGVEQSYTTQGSISLASSSSDLYIGTRNPANNYEGFVKGKIDDIRIYNSTLTESEILSLYNNNALDASQNELIKDTDLFVSSNTLYFSSERDIYEIENISIYNILAQEVYKSREIQNELNLDFLDQGVYILKVEHRHGTVATKKFIIQ